MSRYTYRLNVAHSVSLTIAISSINLGLYDSYAFIVLFLLACAMLLLTARRLPAYITRYDVLIALAITSYFLLGVFDFLYHGEIQLINMDISIEILLCLVLLAYWILFPIDPRYVWIGIAIGVLTAAGHAAWQSLFFGIARPGGFMHPIQFNDLALLFSYYSVLGCFWAYVNRNRRGWYVLFIMGAYAGIFASMLSGGRGGWISIPVIMIFFIYVAYKWRILSNYSIGLAVFVSVCFCIVVANLLVLYTPALKNEIYDRVTFTYRSFETLIEIQSAAKRKSATLPKIIGTAPLFGLNETGYANTYYGRAQQALADNDMIPAISQINYRSLDAERRFFTALYGGAHFLDFEENRFDMWRAVWLLADRAPFFGLGQAGYVQAMEDLIARKQLPSALSEYDEPHNQLFTVYMYQGLLGVVVLCIFYFVPLALFIMRMRTCAAKECGVMAFGGAITVVSVIIFGLTQSFFEHVSGLRSYLLFILLFWILSRPHPQATH